jgi:hypothetical protein
VCGFDPLRRHHLQTSQFVLISQWRPLAPFRANVRTSATCPNARLVDQRLRHFFAQVLPESSDKCSELRDREVSCNKRKFQHPCATRLIRPFFVPTAKRVAGLIPPRIRVPSRPGGTNAKPACKCSPSALPQWPVSPLLPLNLYGSPVATSDIACHGWTPMNCARLIRRLAPFVMPNRPGNSEWCNGSPDHRNRGAPLSA